MEIIISEMHRATLVEVSGRVDSTNAAQLGDALNGQLDAGRHQLVCDLSRVDYISSAGLRELVTSVKRARQANGDLRLAMPSDRVREVLNLSGLDAIFQVFPSQVEAVGSY